MPDHGFAVLLGIVVSVADQTKMANLMVLMVTQLLWSQKLAVLWQLRHLGH